ncbi:MAG: hypothetical protein RBS39_01750 [Phycisphaerales bacterium]|jgi:DNA-directed RNA polymerase subunit RPC12/RpoP|nr:hypothetical protein [Phycisphaerales bacterium]
MKQMILVVVALAAVGGAIYFATQGGQKKSDEGMSREAVFYCANPSCPEHDFSCSLRELGNLEVDEDGNFKCPHCGSFETTRGQACLSCGKAVPYVGHGSMPEKCPHCGQNPVQ